MNEPTPTEPTGEIKPGAAAAVEPERVSATVPSEATPSLSAPTGLSQPHPHTDDEPTSTGNVPAKTSLLEKLRRHGRKLLSIRGITPGRREAPPELDLEDETGDAVPINFSPVRPVAPGPVAASADPAVASLFREVCVGAVEGTLDFLNRITRVVAEFTGYEEKFIDRAITAATPAPKAVLRFTKSLDAVMKKHNVQPKNAEEWALVISAGNLVSGYGAMFLMFAAENKRRAKAEHDARVARLQAGGGK